jgi:SAM-dependent methyltransferase
MPSPGQREPEAALLDVRPEAEFLDAHHPRAASIPLEQLSARVHELPPKNISLRISDRDPIRARHAADFLRKRGHPVILLPWERAEQIVSGASRIRLWRPNPFLLESLERIEVDNRRRLLLARRAIDIACGTGRDAVHLALAGYDVTAIDLLPDALHRAQDLASRNGVHLHTAVRDLEKNPSLPAGGFDLLCVFRYLHRPLFPLLRQSVAPRGYVVYETFHERNRQTDQRPHNPEHLLKSGELAKAFEGFEILMARDEVEREGRFFSSLLARRK